MSDVCHKKYDYEKFYVDFFTQIVIVMSYTSMLGCLVPSHTLPSLNLASVAAIKVWLRKLKPQSVAKVGKCFTL
jgi:hypothetical protein